MKKIVLVFPHQLFKKHPAINSDSRVFIIYEDLFFKQFNFHKTKIAFHNATINFYKDYLIKNKIDCNIIELFSLERFENFFKELALLNIKEIHYCDTVDYLLERRIERYTKKYGINKIIYDNPSFILKNNEIDFYLGEKYFQTNFYVKLRKKLNILIKNAKPIGNKWTFDTENRKKIPKGISLPKPITFEINTYRINSYDYVNQFYPKNYGDLSLEFYAINYDEVYKILEHFLEFKFTNYGIYQDAIAKNEVFLFHSVLSPYLNTGLILPIELIEIVLEYAEKNNIPLNSTEGFIRQIIGWREFIRAIYVKEGTRQRKTNYFGFDKSISSKFWEATTDIEILDDTIKKVLKYSYCHHIERLMILGNFFLLNNYSPNDVYRWFMELFIDAYDWVMVPNVYGMSQYSDGGLITTKPYISSSNYLIKMSNYNRAEWCDFWDALYWTFIIENRNLLENNSRMKIIYNLLEKFNKNKLENFFCIKKSKVI